MIRKGILLIFLIYTQLVIAQNKAELVKSNTAFAFDLYQQFLKANPNENLFFSPYSISEAVAITYAGAANNTDSQIQQVFHFPQQQNDVHTGFVELKSTLKQNTDSVTLKIANSLWAQIDYVFKVEYLNITQTKYNAPAYSVNFKKTNSRKKAVNNMNSWVELNTDYQIHELIKYDDVSEETRLVLVNAIWFYGEWQNAFNENATKEGIFKSLKVEQKTNFMSQKGNYLYYEDDMVTALQIPYKGNKQNMIIILPVKDDGINELDKNFEFSYLENMLGDMRQVSIKVVIPKFSSEYCVDMKNTLEALGMADAFSDNADFSKMTDKNDLKIDKILHKAKIEVSEKGTKAAAATAVLMRQKTAIMNELVFNANHPFIYMIRDNETGTILFFGKFSTVE